MSILRAQETGQVVNEPTKYSVMRGKALQRQHDLLHNYHSKKKFRRQRKCICSSGKNTALQVNSNKKSPLKMTSKSVSFGERKVDKMSLVSVRHKNKKHNAKLVEDFQCKCSKPDLIEGLLHVKKEKIARKGKPDILMHNDKENKPLGTLNVEENLDIFKVNNKTCARGICSKAHKKGKEFVCDCKVKKQDFPFVSCTNKSCNKDKTKTGCPIIMLKDKISQIYRTLSQKFLGQPLRNSESIDPDKICAQGICRDALSSNNKNISCKCKPERRTCIDETCSEHINLTNLFFKLQKKFRIKNKQNNRNMVVQNSHEQNKDPLFEIMVDNIDMCVLNSSEVKTKVLSLGVEKKQNQCICSGKPRGKNILEKKAIQDESVLPVDTKKILKVQVDKDKMCKCIINTEEIKNRFKDVEKPSKKTCRRDIFKEKPKERNTRVNRKSKRKGRKRHKMVRSNINTTSLRNIDTKIRSLRTLMLSKSETYRNLMKRKKKRQLKGPMRHDNQYNNIFYTQSDNIHNERKHSGAIHKRVGIKFTLKKKFSKKGTLPGDSFNTKNPLALSNVGCCACETEIDSKRREIMKSNDRRLEAIRRKDKEQYIFLTHKNETSIADTFNKDNRSNQKSNKKQKHRKQSVPTEMVKKKILCKCDNVLCKCDNVLCKCKSMEYTRKLQRDKLKHGKRIKKNKMLADRQKTQKHKRLKKKATEQEKKWIQENKQQRKRRIREMKKTQKAEKKRQKQYRKETREMMKELNSQKETEQSNCIVVILQSLFAGLFYIFKGVLYALFKVIISPRKSFWYVREKMIDPENTILMIKRKFMDAWRIRKLKISKCLGNSDTVSILSDTFKNTALYETFGGKGKTEKEKLRIASEAKKRKLRIRKREDQALYGCRHMLLTTLRKTPCLWFYFICPNMYPQCLNVLSILKTVTHLFLFTVAIVSWTPCIILFELMRGLCCCLLCTG